jgi:hypothetical protein
MTKNVQGEFSVPLCFGRALGSGVPSRIKDPESVFAGCLYRRAGSMLEKVNLDTEALFDMERLREFIGLRICPYLQQLMSQPFDKVVKEKLQRAECDGDSLRARVLEDLMQADLWYFPLDQSPWPQTRFANKFRKTFIVAAQQVADFRRRLPKQLRKILPAEKPHERPIRAVIPGQLEKPNEYFIRKSLRLE